MASLAYALSGPNLVTFNLANPASPTSSVIITGLLRGQTLVGIDIRPQNGLLYGFGVDPVADVGTLYTISYHSTTTGVATIVGSIVPWIFRPAIMGSTSTRQSIAFG